MGLRRRLWYDISLSARSAYANNSSEDQKYRKLIETITDYIFISELKDVEVSSQSQEETSVVIDKKEPSILMSR